MSSLCSIASILASRFWKSVFMSPVILAAVDAKPLSKRADIFKRSSVWVPDSEREKDGEDPPGDGLRSAEPAAKKKATKKAAAGGAKKGSKKPSGPSVSNLIVTAVAASKERSGVSLAALKKLLAAGGYDVDKNNSRLKIAIRALVTKGSLVQVKGHGASGSFKINKKQQEGDKAKKVTIKKKPSAAAKPKKPAAAKKPAKSPKKKAPSKAAKSPKKAAKKPAKAAAAPAKKATKSPKKPKAAAKPKKAAKSPAKKAAKAKTAAKPKKAAPKKK
ncbi:uncharacterized protein LOC143973635 [Lithobates pipiens]